MFNVAHVFLLLMWEVPSLLLQQEIVELHMTAYVLRRDFRNIFISWIFILWVSVFYTELWPLHDFSAMNYLERTKQESATTFLIQYPE